jgi:hypothetical protein
MQALRRGSHAAVVSSTAIESTSQNHKGIAGVHQTRWLPEWWTQPDANQKTRTSIRISVDTKRHISTLTLFAAIDLSGGVVARKCPSG